MATGKKAQDIFSRTVRPADIGLEVTPRVYGRPRTAEAYAKITICLFERQTLWLDRLSLEIRERTGKKIRRAELVRAMVDHAAGKIRPGQPDFDRAIRELLPTLEG